MKNTSFTLIVLLLGFSVSVPALAENEGARLIHMYQGHDINVGLVNMDSIDPECQQIVGTITVKGIQFSKSGNTLESFWFVDKNGTRWSVPTNIGNLSNVEVGYAGDFIKIGKPYFVHIQVCGSGGFSSLINMYDLSSKFSVK